MLIPWRPFAKHENPSDEITRNSALALVMLHHSSTHLCGDLCLVSNNRSWPLLFNRLKLSSHHWSESPLARSMHLLIDVDVFIDVWDRPIVTSVVHLQKHISISRGRVCNMIASATKQSKVTCWQCVRGAEGIEVVCLHVVRCGWRGCKEILHRLVGQRRIVRDGWIAGSSLEIL